MRPRLLIISIGFLGDTVQTLPAFFHLQKKYPETEIELLLTPIGAEVVQLTTLPFKLWSYPLSQPSPPWWQSLRLISQLRHRHYDEILVLSGGLRSRWLSLAIGAKERSRVALPGDRSDPWIMHWMNRRETLVKSENSEPLPLYQLFLRALQATPPTPEIPLFPPVKDEADAAWVKDLKLTKAIHLSINTASPLKEWPMPSWIELIHCLLNDDWDVIVTSSGSAREQQRQTQLSQAIPSPRLHCVKTRLPLARLLALLRACELHVGGDSGVVHLAWAAGVSTVTLHRQHPHLSLWQHTGDSHRSLVASCACLLAQTQDCLTQSESACLRNISVAEVFRMIRQTAAISRTPNSEPIPST